MDPRLLLLVLAAHVTYGKCPYKCYCTGGGAYCQGITRFPDFSDMPSWTVNISLYHMNIDSIPSSAFKDLPNIKTISIYDGSIGHIHPCAFQGLRNVDKIELYNLDIKTIDMYAFSDMRYIKSMTLYSNRIDSIKSYAFYNINGVKSLTLHTLTVRRINTRAFYSIGSVDAFNMYGNNITMIRRGAFSRSKFRSVNMFYNYIVNLECQTIDVLKSESTKNFSFYSNELYCGCHMAWLLRSDKKSLLSDSKGPVKCGGPNSRHRGTTALQLTSSDLDCRGQPYLTRSLSCPGISVPPPARTRARQCLKRY